MYELGRWVMLVRTMVERFRQIGYLEGTSFLLLLFVAMPLKYFADMPLAVRYVGWAHGLLFILYIVAAYQKADAEQWPGRKLITAFVAAVVPFGPFVFDRKYA